MLDWVPHSKARQVVEESFWSNPVFIFPKRPIAMLPMVRPASPAAGFTFGSFDDESSRCSKNKGVPISASSRTDCSVAFSRGLSATSSISEIDVAMQIQTEC